MTIDTRIALEKRFLASRKCSLRVMDDIRTACFCLRGVLLRLDDIANPPDGLDHLNAEYFVYLRP